MNKFLNYFLCMFTTARRAGYRNKTHRIGYQAAGPVRFPVV